MQRNISRIVMGYHYCLEYGEMKVKMERICGTTEGLRVRKEGTEVLIHWKDMRCATRQRTLISTVWLGMGSRSVPFVQTEDVSLELGCDLHIYLKHIPLTEEGDERYNASLYLITNSLAWILWTGILKPSHSCATTIYVVEELLQPNFWWPSHVRTTNTCTARNATTEY
jgi:hypothetical protein